MDYFEVFLTGALEKYFGLSSTDVTMASAWVNFFVFSIVFLKAAYFDQKSHIVPENICARIAIYLLLYNAFFVGIFGTLIALLVTILTFSDKEIEVFGQADFLIMGHAFTCCLFNDLTLYSMLALFSSWLLCLCFYLAFYRSADGRKWKPFKGMMMPAFPPYAGAVILGSALRVLLIYKHFGRLI